MNSIEPMASPGLEPKMSKSVLISCMVGNALEWYDFVIYGYFAAVFGALFFPNASPVTQALASWGVFWSGFLARPIGAAVFGHMGDKTSRKSALTLSIYLMAIPSVLIGCLPTYAQIGILAPILLVVFRTFQGFAIGGEFTGSMVFLVEFAGKHNRGMAGSWATFSSVIGVIFGSAIITLLSYSLEPEAMRSWGWRVAFLISIAGSVVGGYLRTRMSDPSIYLEAKSKRKQAALPIREAFSLHKSKMLAIFFIDTLTAVGFFILAIFLATYFRNFLKYPDHIALAANTIAMILFAASCLLGGALSDKIGRRAVLSIACLGFIILSYPMFQLMQQGNPYLLTLAQSVLVVLMGLFYGTIPVTLCEIMPTSVRFSGLSIAHNVSMAVFGGGAPLLATYLLQTTHDLLTPSFLLIGASSISLVAALLAMNHRSSFDSEETSPSNTDVM